MADLDGVRGAEDGARGAGDGDEPPDASPEDPPDPPSADLLAAVKNAICGTPLGLSFYIGEMRVSGGAGAFVTFASGR